MLFRRLIALAGIFLSLSACLPGMTPTGSPSNPAGAKAPSEEVAAPSGPEGESSSIGDVPSTPGPSDAVPRSLDVPAPPSSFDGPKAGPGPAGDGGGGGSGFRDGATQIAKGGGGFCPKPDEVSLEDVPLAKDWRAYHGFGTWWEELSKTAPVSLAVGEGKPFDLYLNVQAYLVSMFCEQWAEPLPQRVTVRLIFKSAARNLAITGHMDAPVLEKTADGYNVAFRGITASDGLIDVYAYVDHVDANWNLLPPPADDAVFVADTSHARYLGSLATKVTAALSIEDQMPIPKSLPRF
jgi:hypothetical protein